MARREAPTQAAVLIKPSPGNTAQRSMATKLTTKDEHIAEAVARQGGYEEVERNNKWAMIANALGMRKDLHEKVKARYEDMLRVSAEMDEREEQDEDEEYEVDTILDSRTDKDGNIEYLVKWKFEDDGEGDDGDDEDRTTWEPRENLACPELLQQFEDNKREKRLQQRAEASAAEAAEAGGAAPPAANREASSSAIANGTASSADAASSSSGDVAAAASSASRKRAGAPGYGRFERILRACRPVENKPILFEVECADGTKAIVPSVTLRSEAPLVLVDFYESRIRFAN
jgi:chromobox protein 5